MPFDAFLKIEGIQGDSLDAAHKGEIEILSFSMGLSNESGGGSGSGSGAGKVVFSPLHFTSRTNKASPLLFLACASGQHFAKAGLTLRRVGGKSGLEFEKWALNDVQVSSYQQGGDTTSDAPVDSFGLTFAKVQITFTPSDSKGGPGTPASGTWDVKANKAGDAL